LNTPLTKRDYARFGINVFKENFDILFVDFTKFLYPLVKKDTYIKKDNIGYDYLSVETHDEIISSCNQLNQQDQIVLLFHYNQKTLPIFIELSKKKLNYSIFMQNSVPLPKKSGKRNNYYNKIFDKKLLAKIKNRILNNIKLSKKLFNLKYPNYLLLGGKQSKNNYSDYKLKGNATKELYSHTLDYNDYLDKLKNKKSERLVNDKYAVLIDAPGPLFLADALTLGYNKSRLSTKNYFPSINNFLSILENYYDLKFVIAGHPHSKYEEFPKYFDSRRVIYNKTGELIKDCEFVVTRGSTAINFAVIFNKPILFYTTKECESYQDIRESILSFASCFDKLPINIDKLNSNIKYEDKLEIDSILYKNYKKNYIKTPNSPEENSWLILKRELLD